VIFTNAWISGSSEKKSTQMVFNNTRTARVPMGFTYEMNLRSTGYHAKSSITIAAIRELNL
jgi:hypothetical protein